VQAVSLSGVMFFRKVFDGKERGYGFSIKIKTSSLGEEV